MKNPKLISKPFAQNGQKNVIPEKYETSMESNQATWDQGFGQITMLPVSAGGLPPKGQDFNGILNQISETLVHISKGGVFKFSADYAVAINGYPKGAILQSEDEKKYYQSLIDNNKVNFNTASQDQIKTSWKLVMTDDLLNQLSKKLESSAVVQFTGTSTTSVMSQKASTDSFQPKGNYASGDNFSVHTGSSAVRSPNKLYTLEIQNDGQLVVGDATSGTPKAVIRFTKEGELSTGSVPANKISGLSKGVGGSENAIMSQKASTDSFQPKGDYATTQSLTEGLSQKLDNTGGYVTGFILSENELGVKTSDRHISIITSDAVRGPHIAVKENANDGYGRFTFPAKSGALLASSNISQSTGTSTTSVMSQKASTDSFQPKGDYATKLEFNVNLNKKVDKASISQQLANDVNKVPSLDLLAKELGKKQASGDYGAKNTANKSESGWWKCGDTGLIYQFGIVTGCVNQDDSRTFTIPFPNKCLSIIGGYLNENEWGQGISMRVIDNKTFFPVVRSASGSWVSSRTYYIAIGY
ncbi:gp53-like domain-containing protein [Proteus mirabilis]|uniref:gp53-like domain-containing protein n=1 Tax=Proteus mirabilis TaxID=584 RepID=UPI0034D4B2BE